MLTFPVRLGTYSPFSNRSLVLLSCPQCSFLHPHLMATLSPSSICGVPSTHFYGPTILFPWSFDDPNVNLCVPWSPFCTGQHTSTSKQITAVTWPVVSHQKIQKAVAKAQRQGITRSALYWKCWSWCHPPLGQNHPVCISQWAKSSMPPPAAPSSQRQHNTQSLMTSK